MGAACSAPAGFPAPGKITVWYWGPHGDTPFYGRGIGIYLTLDQAGFPYEKKPAMEMPGGFVAGGAADPKAYAPPAVEIDGTFMAQCTHILSVLGQTFGLAGKTSAEQMQVLHALGDMDDVFGVHGKFKDDEALKKKWFGYLDKKLAGKTWIGGTTEPTIADFHGVFSFCWIDAKGIDYSEYPNLAKWSANIKAYPVVKKMFDSCVDGRKMIPS